MRTRIIFTTGVSEEVKPLRGSVFNLRELILIVGGRPEDIYLSDGSVMVVNEEGKKLGLPFNREATNLLDGTHYEGDFICGDVILTEFKN